MTKPALWMAIVAISASLSGTAMAQATTAPPVHVKGYTTKEGTAVAPHDQTAPDKTKANNWSTKDNTNPETGKKGDKPLVKK